MTEKEVVFLNFVLAAIWTLLLLWNFAINSCIPLGLEMLVDTGYPVCEGTSTSIGVWMFSVIAFILVFVLEFLPSKFYDGA